MITQKITMRQAVQSLRSTVCPCCGGPKKRAQTLCRSDYFKLPREMRNATYDGVGDGYEEAVTCALNFLGAEKVHMPGAESSD